MEVRIEGGAVEVVGDDRTLTYSAEGVTLSDGSTLRHTSVGGDLESVWAGDLGDAYVEVVHLGAGPTGGELVLVVPAADVVAVGDLVRTETPDDVPPTWPAAIDLALGLMGRDTRVSTSDGMVTRDDVEAFHQRLLGVLHG